MVSYVSRPSLHQFQWTLSSPLSKANFYGTILSHRTPMTIPQIITLLEVCLKNTYFLYQGKYCEQVQGAPIGSPINPSSQTSSQMSLESRPSVLPPLHPWVWLRYVDDTVVIKQAEHNPQFLKNINILDLHIQLTVENPKENGSIPFLDTLISLEPNNTLSTSVYKNLTHINQYLHRDSKHNLPAKHSAYKTFALDGLHKSSSL